MESKKSRPKHVKKERSNVLEDLFNRITEDFDADRNDDVYAVLQQQLEEKALELLNKGNFSNERIAKMMAYFLMKYEKHMVNETEIKLKAYEAKEVFEDIVQIEESTPTGGRPQNDYLFGVAKQSFEEYERNHRKHPSSNQLSALAEIKLKKKLELLKIQFIERNPPITKEDEDLFYFLSARARAEKAGNFFYSPRTALEHINRIKNLRKSSDNTQEPISANRN
jgi:hypothetical protein